jgi:protein-tyrosine phosphatase
MRLILDAGVTCFLDLTTRHDPLLPYESLVEQLAGAGAMRIHYPVTDMGIPESTAQTREILDTIDRVIDEGGTIYVHCWGGIGRTGTIVGCWLVRHGMTGEEALDRVKELWETRPDSGWSTSPQTDDQFDYVRKWQGGK